MLSMHYFGIVDVWTAANALVHLKRLKWIGSHNLQAPQNDSIGCTKTIDLSSSATDLFSGWVSVTAALISGCWTFFTPIMLQIHHSSCPFFSLQIVVLLFRLWAPHLIVISANVLKACMSCMTFSRLTELIHLHQGVWQWIRLHENYLVIVSQTFSLLCTVL